MPPSSPRDLRSAVLPTAPAAVNAAQLRALRRSLRASQAVFARFLNVSTQLVQAWEGERRRPEGAALRLLEIARRDPGAVFEGFAEPRTKPHTKPRAGTHAGTHAGSPSPVRDRATVRVRVMRQHDDIQGTDTLAMTPAERLEMMWPLARSAWAFTGGRVSAEPGLSRHVVRIQRRAR